MYIANRHMKRYSTLLIIEKANQSHNQISSYTCQKNLQTTKVGNNLDKKEPLYTVSRNGNLVQTLWKSIQFPQNTY